MDKPGLVKDYRDLAPWQRGLDLVQLIYELTRAWPREEIYALTSQIRRAAISIPSNIAEGQGRASDRDFHHHLSIARGSLREVVTQSYVAHRLGYISQSDLDRILAATDQIARPLNGLMKKLADRS